MYRECKVLTMISKSGTMLKGGTHTDHAAEPISRPPRVLAFVVRKVLNAINTVFSQTHVLTCADELQFMGTERVPLACNRCTNRILYNRLRLKMVKVGVLPLLILPYPAISQSYSIEGSVEYRVFRPGAVQQPPPLFRSFTATIRNDVWQIVMRTKSTNFQSFVYQYDGTNLLSFATTPDFSGKDATGILEPNPVPQSWTSAAGEYVWLAFASARYFLSRTDHTAMFIRPMPSYQTMVHREILPAAWTLNPDLPRLPLRIEYKRDVMRVFTNDGTVITNRLPDPFGEGYVQGVYTSSLETNVSGLSLPRNFEYREFCPSPSARVDEELVCVLEVKGQANSFTVPATVVMVSPPKMHVRDDRLPEPSVVYPITNRVVPSPDAQFVSERRSDYVHKRKLLEALKQKRTGAAIAVLAAVVLLSPLALYALTRRRAMSKQNEEPKSTYTK